MNLMEIIFMLKQNGNIVYEANKIVASYIERVNKLIKQSKKRP